MAYNRELSQFASFLVVNDTTGNIGIASTGSVYVGVGTTNPGARLDVQGPVAIGSGTAYDNTYATLILKQRPAADGYASLSFQPTNTNFVAKIDAINSSNSLEVWSNKNSTDGSRFRIAMGSNDEFISFSPRASEAARIIQGGAVLIGSATSTGTASQSFQVTGGAYVSGNLGLGVTNPSHKLDILGNVRSFGTTSPSFIVTPTSGSSYIFGANTAITGSGIYDNTASAWRLVAKDTTGNILIATTSETGTSSQKLQVSGGAYVSGSIGVGATNPTSKLFVTQASSDQSTGESATHAIALSSGNNGRTMWMGYDDTIDAGYINAAKTGQSRPIYLQTRNLVNTAVTFVGIATTAPTGTQNQYLQVGGGGYFGGNLGIGTTNPTSSLHVSGNTLLSGVTTFTGDVTFGSNAYFGDGDILNFGNGNDLQIYHTGSETYISDEGTGDLNIRTNKLNITDTGNNLRAVFDTNITNGSVSLYYGFGQKEFETTGYGATVFGVLQTQGLFSSGVSTISVNSSSDALRITQTGSGNALVVEDSTNPDATPFVVGAAGTVGVGTNNPFAGNPGTNQGIDVFGGNPTVVSRMNGNTAEATVWVVDQDFYSLPSYKGVGLRKYGTGASGTTAGISNADLGALALQNTANALIYTNGQTPLIFATQSTEAFRIDSSQRIGIGTINPTSKLHVVGNSLLVGVSTFAGNVTFQNNAYFGDNDKLYFGNGNDLEIYHDGSNSYIDDSGTGDLYIRSNALRLQKYTGETTAAFFADNSVELYHDNVKKFETTTSGISVGAIGISTVGIITGPSEIIIDPAAVNDNTGSVRIKGDLYVDGAQFIVNSGTIELGDFNVGIATTVGTNSLLDGAGIGIGSASIRKTLTWDNTNSALKSSENFNLASGKAYEINGTTLLTENTFVLGGIATANSFRARGGTPGANGISGNGYGFFSPGDNDSGMYSSADGQIEFYTNNSESFRINAGNILVGGSGTSTGTSLQRLQVYSSAYISDTLGIGVTNNTTYKLDVNGTSRFGANAKVFLNTGVAVGQDGVSINPLTNTRTDIQAETQGTGYRVLALNPSGGSVGVGITNPTNRFVVGGDTAQFAQQLQVLSTLHATSRRAAIAIGGTAGSQNPDWQILQDTVGNGTKDFAIYSTAVAQSLFRIDTTGNSIFQYYPLLVGSATSTGTASQALQVTGSAYVSGNLGVGITNTAYKLDVLGVAKVGLASTAILLGNDNGRNVDVGAGSTNLDCYIDFHGTPTYSDHAGRLIRTAGDNSNFDLINRGTGALRIVSQDAGTIDFATNNIVRARIDSSGTVLVGSSSSTGSISQKLQVTGGAYFNVAGISTGSIGVGVTNPQGTIDIRSSPQWSSFNYGANLIIGGSRNNGLGILDSTNSNPWTIANNAGNLVFAQMPALGNTTTAATEAARITTNRNLVVGSITETGVTNQRLQVVGGASFSGSNSNVGIGITNPSTKLDVYVTSGNAIRGISHPSYSSTPNNYGVILGISTNAASSNASQFAAAGLGVTSGELGVYSFYPTFANYPTDTAARRAVDLVAGFSTYTWGTEYFAINVGRNGNNNDSAVLTNERLRITGTGNVGIGTSVPIVKLHVSDGNGGISTGLYTSDFVAISAQNTSPGFNIIVSGSDPLDRGVFKATRARGTLSSPTVPLAGDNTFSLLGAIYDGSTNRATAAVNMEVDGTVGVGTAPQRITFLTGTGTSRVERARITSSGNVGIATTNPGAQIHVVPTSTGVAGLFSGTTSDDMVRITQLGSGNALVVEDSANPDVSPFVVRGNGNVGLGTNDPNFAADVGGDVRVQDGNKMRFGGKSNTISNYYIQYNSTANSLDFVAG